MNERKFVESNIDDLLKQIDSQSQEQESEQAEREDTPPIWEQQRPQLHVYVLNQPLEDYLQEQNYGQDIEGDLLPESKEESIPTTSIGAPASPPIKTHTVGAWRLPFIVCLLALMGLLGGLSIAIATLFETASASVTILPVQNAITTASTIIVVQGRPKTAPDELQGRLFSRLTLRGSQTRATTGRGHQNAQAARGLLTLYNSSLQTQMVAVGTTLTGTDGVVIVTEQNAVIPPGDLQVNGHVTVWAHAAIVGPAGNIRGGDIYGPCCRLNVSAANAAFSGGQNARDFPVVTPADLDTAKASLTSSLTKSMTAVMQTHLRADETLITPLPCTQRATSDHVAGEEATQVSVTLEETCIGEAYSSQAFHDLVKQIVSQQASKQLGAGYTLAGGIQATILQSIQQKGGAISLQFKGTGSWVYQFSQKQLDGLAAQIAGKSKAQATDLLLHLPEVSSISANITGPDTQTLPSDAQHIHVVELIYVPS